MARKFDEGRVIQMAEMGLACTEIAKTQGVAVSTITRFLKEQGDEIMDLPAFRVHQDDVLTALQRASAEVRFRILAELKRRGVESMSTNELRAIYHSLAVTAGVDFDKSRLLRGQSTDNISLLAKIKKNLDELDPA
jgi:transposase